MRCEITYLRHNEAVHRREVLIYRSIVENTRCRGASVQISRVCRIKFAPFTLFYSLILDALDATDAN